MEFGAGPLKERETSRPQRSPSQDPPGLRFCLFVYFSCRPTKTITLEIDAYEKLRAAKRGGESFTEVVRRAVIPASAPTGNLSGSTTVTEEAT